VTWQDSNLGPAGLQLTHRSCYPAVPADQVVVVSEAAVLIADPFTESFRQFSRGEAGGHTSGRRIGLATSEPKETRR
jgi:hypothetical protein